MIEMKKRRKIIFNCFWVLPILSFVINGCADENKLVLYLKNVSYTREKVNFKIRLNGNLVLDTLIKNDSIDHRFNVVEVPLSKGDYTIEISSDSTELGTVERSKIHFPSTKEITIIYNYTKREFYGRDTVLSPSKFDILNNVSTRR